jgi:hypothetical protein
MSTYNIARLQTSIILAAGLMLSAQGLRDFIDRRKNRIPSEVSLAFVNTTLGALVIFIWYTVYRLNGSNSFAN